MNSPGIAASVSELRHRFPTLNIGAGTVCTEADLRVALDAGTQFIVMPIVAEAVIRTCTKQRIPVFLGAYTPTEIYHAWSLDASAVKVFPAGQLGVGYIRDVLGPLNQLKLLPTGGVDRDNLGAFLEAGAIGVGMGSSLMDKQRIAAGDFDGLRAHFTKIGAKFLEGAK